MIDFLYQIPAESLETLAFRVSLTDGGGSEELDVFGELPGLLQSSSFNHLQKVRFIQQGPLTLDAAEEALRRTFPHLHAKGILVVAPETEPTISRRP